MRVVLVTKIRIGIEVEIGMETGTKMLELTYGSVGYDMEVNATNSTYGDDGGLWVDYLVSNISMNGNSRGVTISQLPLLPLLYWILH